MARAVHVYLNDDWEGLYVDGDLKAQGHSLHTQDILDALGVSHEARSIEDENVTFLPDKLEDVPE